MEARSLAGEFKEMICSVVSILSSFLGDEAI